MTIRPVVLGQDSYVRVSRIADPSVRFSQARALGQGPDKICRSKIDEKLDG